MITILITAAANAAIGASLPKGAKASPAGPGEGGGFCLTLDLETIERLTALSRPRESYSDVILRLATASEALPLKPPPNAEWPPSGGRFITTKRARSRRAICGLAAALDFREPRA